MTIFAALLGLTPTTFAQVTPIPQFVGNLGSESFEAIPYQAGAMCLNPQIFAGTVSMCTPGQGGTNVTSGWSFQCFLPPNGGTHFYGSMSGATEFTFQVPASQFGGFFATNSGSVDFTVEFFDANGGSIDFLTETFPGQCGWSWFGWQIPGGATRIVIGGGQFGGAFVMMDDLEATDDVDFDDDGINDDVDNCPEVPNLLQEDVDLDGVGDDCDSCWLRANADQADADGDGVGNLCECIGGDPDSDGVQSGCDTCPTVADPAQADQDGDGVGNLCDQCPADFDPPQLDVDSDGVGDGCDICPTTSDPDQEDADADGLGDACDVCPDPVDPTDSDLDGVCDGDDVCNGFSDFEDVDQDGVADGCDPCPLDVVNDTDGDGVCDADDLCPDHDDTGPDADDDGYVDGCDNCGSVWQRDQRDYDKDGFGDLCDCKIGKAEAHPGADELCNEEDDDCDGEVDEEAIDAVAVWPDADGDGQGNAAAPWSACVAGEGYVDNGDDCDDAHAEALVGGLEICDDLDNDCDGEVDPAELNCDPDTSISGESTICGCASTGPGGAWLGLAAGGLLLLRRRRAA